jgi:fatty-acyl-CoA synthase
MASRGRGSPSVLHSHIHATSDLGLCELSGSSSGTQREIESFCTATRRSGDVQVIGVPDLKYGEEVCAWIRLVDGEHATEDELREYCRSQIASCKIPRYIRFATEFPTTVTGKIRSSGCARSPSQNLAWAARTR